MRVKPGVLVGALLSLLTTVTVANSASAAPAGLTAAQAAEVQNEVDRGLAELGGRQVAANRIVAGDGSVVTYVLPGEKYAHVLGDGLDGNNPQTAKVLCAYGAFCGWKNANYSGTGRTWSACGVFFEIPDGWNSGGSWINNQTHHYVTTMLGKHYEWVYDTPPAYSSDDHGNWAPVWYVYNNC